ncbi:hypothetical protein [Agromyces aerolatus]|uniref:hypothetical protein n=1 Tax=Agromyces sp. LY-1074 TaxID=3074080 RepID=UPI00285AAF26|nr:MULTISPECIES: hypothetical protein [unclassified Agromyces]MDR5699608.1 hypothetical protein [Agromyces sp. LY-1074]MDR5705904.1 hypothetical protein [Agromyces sp. LY-1358]
MPQISIRRRLVVSAVLLGGATAMLATLVSGWGLLWFLSIALILFAGVLAAFEYAAQLQRGKPPRQ